MSLRPSRPCTGPRPLLALAGPTGLAARALQADRSAGPGRRTQAARAAQGMSLIVVLLILVVVSVLGVGAAQMALLGERASRYDRDYQVGWHAGNAGLGDAHDDMEGRQFGGSGLAMKSSRGELFDPNGNLFEYFKDGSQCVDAADDRLNGLCPSVEAGPPRWQTIDLTAGSGRFNAYTQMGEFTGRAFVHGQTGVQPEELPRYVIEWLPAFHAVLESAKDGSGDKEAAYFRVTAMGFGPREETRVVQQEIYRRSAVSTP